MDLVFRWLVKRAIINPLSTFRKRKLTLAATISAQNPSTPFSVSQLNRQVKRILEGHFDFVWIEGELSNLAQPGSGHWYFSLKDASAQVRCAMFRNRNQRLRLSPRNGQQVLVRARVSLYEGRGEYQLIVEHLEDAGAGALQQQFEALKEKLALEGLFDPANKQTMPAFPRQIALITSPTGAAVRDLLTVFGRRFPCVALTVLPVPVQGPAAAPAIAAALALAKRSGTFDAVVLARGGGSMEDLWAFNEEAVARAIAASDIPVLSAIGHETDFTIADFVADHRAATPSAAAEILSPDQYEIRQKLANAQVQLARALSQQVATYAERLAGLRRHLRHPGERIREQSQRIDDYELRLRRGILRHVESKRHSLTGSRARLQAQAPLPQMNAMHLQLSDLYQRATQATQQGLHRAQQGFVSLAAKLDSLSPLATLQRGYAIVSDENGLIVTNVARVNKGDLLTTRLAVGSLHSQVVDKEE
jgi:exodeoxyribonuclease VII large subunit